MIIQNVRADWLFILEANKKGKFGMCCIVPNDSPQHKQVANAIKVAIAKGISTNKFTEAGIKSKTFMKCLRNGNEEIETEDRPKHYKDCMFFNANSQTTPPGVIGADRQPILDKNTIFSGCYFHIDVDFYPYVHKDGGKGIACGLKNVMFVKEGDRLDGRQSAEEAFGDIQVEGDLQ